MSATQEAGETSNSELPKRGRDVGSSSFQRLLRERERMARRCEQRVRRPRDAEDTPEPEAVPSDYVSEKPKPKDH